MDYCPKALHAVSCGLFPKESVKNKTQTQILKPTPNKNPVTPAAQLAQYKPREVKGKAPDLEIYRSSSFMSTTQLT